MYKSLAISITLVTVLSAQGAPPEQNVATTLAAPVLRANATITQHNPPGSPLASTLSNARDAAPSRGIEWKGLVVTAFDPPSSIAAVTDALLINIYKRRACLADAIVVGHTASSLSHLSAYGTAVYTDYVFVNDTVLKDNTKAPIRESQIVVTRQGGSIVLPAGPLKYDSQEYPNLLPGRTYLQFLTFLPESLSYHAIDAFSTLVTKSDSWVIARNAASARALPELRRGAFEAIVSGWLKSCE